MKILFSTEGGELSKTFSARSLIIFEGGFPGPGVLSGQHKAWHMPGALQMFVEWSIDIYSTVYTVGFELVYINIL